MRTLSIRRGVLVLAACMAVASASFMLSLNHTSVAHVLFLQALSPLVAALLGAKLIGERPRLLTLLAMLIAIGGVVVMVNGRGGGSELGDGLALLTAIAFAVVLVVARHDRGVSTPTAICLSQLMIVIVFAPFASLRSVPLDQVGWLALMGWGQVMLGTLFFSLAARHIPAAEIALIFLIEIVLGPLWTWIGVSERPSTATLVGGGVVLIAIVLQIGAGRSARLET
jgi:drug/metabolite transporter (DMT)-like permease